MNYNYLLTFHIVAFTSWMAMLFYLPRLFVYHVEHWEKKEFKEVVTIQEDKLYNFIGWPSLLATLTSGLALLIINPALFQSGGWLHVKLLATFLLVIYHFSLGYFKKQLKTCPTRSGRFFRIYNEVPTILMIMIVICVVAKPF